MAAVSGLIRVMERAARKAGGKLRRDFREVEHLQVSRKGPSDFVSKADQAAERTIYDELLQARPDWGFVMEEAGTIEGDPLKPRWIVDPLDGTSNFLHGIPHFAISIAAQEPRLDGDKTKNGGLGRCDRGGRLPADHRRDLLGREEPRRLAAGCAAEGILAQPPRRCAGRHRDSVPGAWRLREWTKIFREIGPQVAGIRRFGAASLDLAWVAAGRFDGFWETGLSPWDTAAGCLLVREAGGFVTDFRGRSQPVCDTEVLAANDPLHSRLHKLLVAALKP